MGKPVVITASEQTVAQGTAGWLNSIFFHNNVEGSESRVRILSGGSSGTAVFDSIITDGSETGQTHVSHTWGGPSGGRIEDGIYVEITGTLSVNLEYTAD